MVGSIGPVPRCGLGRPPGARRFADGEPATLIGALYPREVPLTDFLIELEDDLPTLGAVVAELRRMAREDNGSASPARFTASTSS